MEIFKILKKYIFCLFLFQVYVFFPMIALSEENVYEAKFDILNCRGVATLNSNMYLSKWKFYPTGGSGGEIDIRYDGKKKLGRIRTSVYENGDLYGRGKWIGRTASRTYNTLVTIHFINVTKEFSLVSDFNPNIFRLMGKCK